MTLVNTETSELVEITEADVDASIARVIGHAESIWDEWVWQVENQTWLIKGYGSWDEMRHAVYTDLNGVTAPRAERPELVSRFRAAGLTQKQTAETIGVSQRTVSNYDEPQQVHPPRASSNFATREPGDEPREKQSNVRLPSNERAEQITTLVDRGATSEQIANELGLTTQQVRNIAKQHDIAIRADIVRGKRQRFNHDRVLDNVTESLEVAAISLRNLDAQQLDREEAVERLDSLTSSIKALRQAVQKIKESFHE